LAGRLSDRFGPRLVLTIGGLLIGLGYLLMSQVNAIWQIYFFYGVLVSIGMGGMVVPLMSTSARWFAHRRGLTSGIIMAGVGIGIFITPPVANYLISSYNWRTSYIILGLVALVLITFLAQFVRRAPNHSGLLTQQAASVISEGSHEQIHGLSLRDALRTRTLWILSVMCLFLGFGVHTVMAHIVAHATDINIPTAASATILSAIGVVSTVGKIGMGRLGDRKGNRKIWILHLDNIRR
jgi:OFA family oxalate/formate antiporter-like MFS transporter